MFFEKILRQLQDRQVRYLVIGGVAVNLHGYARATADLDLMLAMDDGNITRTIDLFATLGWKPRAPVALQDFCDARQRQAWIENKGLKAFTIYNPDRDIEHLDILLDHPLDFDEAYDRRVVMRSGKLEIPVVSIDDLISLKQVAPRQRDVLDIKALQQIKELLD